MDARQVVLAAVEQVQPSLDVLRQLSIPESMITATVLFMGMEVALNDPSLAEKVVQQYKRDMGDDACLINTADYPITEG